MNKIYLAGGFKTDWRKQIKELKGFIFYDPKEKEYNKEYNTRLTPRLYTAWDLHYLKKCDICFVYFENTNPSGYGLSLEMGYAKALGKTVISVFEPGHPAEKYFDILKESSDSVFDHIEDALDYLMRYQ